MIFPQYIVKEKCDMLAPHSSEKVRLYASVWTRCTSVTDRQTDRNTYIQLAVAYMQYIGL